MGWANWWRASVGPVAAICVCLPLVACASLATKAQSRGGDTVTQWTLIADDYGNGAANWRTLAIMQMAMHDALNAADPIYRRWWPATADEPAPDGANPEVAMASAALEVLRNLHPTREEEILAAFADVMARYPDDASKAAGKRLGAAIGRAALARRSHDGFDGVHAFVGDDAPGRWRPTPTRYATSSTNDARPFLFGSVTEVQITPPPSLGSPLYLKELAEIRRMGALHSPERTPEQTTAALFWAYQTSQRGFVNLAVRLLAEQRPHRDIHAEARVMAELTAALADSAILVWHAKETYSFWRPITALRASGVDPTWEPLIETPPFPEYPSGHATDCYVGAGILEAELPHLDGPIEYLSSAYLEPLSRRSVALSQASYGMGQHAQPTLAQAPGGHVLRFSSLGAAALNCASSRIWAGAHFTAAETEAEHLATIIVRRALSATLPATVPSRDAIAGTSTHR